MPGIYAVTSIPLVNRTRAIFRSAEFGFLGVIVLTLMHTPRLNGLFISFLRLLRVLKTNVMAGDLDFLAAIVRDFLTSWLIVATVGGGNQIRVFRELLHAQPFP